MIRADTELDAATILGLFDKLNQELARQKIVGELYLVGGAVMCIVYKARPSTRDLDAAFRPTQALRQAAVHVARETGLPQDWLNDAVKGYLGDQGEYDPFLDLDFLKVYVAQPAYLLALKCRAMRIGAGFRDLDDIRYLLRFLNIEEYSEAIETICQYFSLKAFPQKTLYALEELLLPPTLPTEPCCPDPEI